MLPKKVDTGDLVYLSKLPEVQIGFQDIHEDVRAEPWKVVGKQPVSGQGKIGLKIRSENGHVTRTVREKDLVK
ncbi:hypothetical protein EVJ58_g8860 [Rhodofomes roseus]|uniref:Uncharacterized protein n=1 Tax=Rhodofomes roseus TaxID=34475 RepID=A0A4Y9XYE4_9APHY|nr:hypothetical protein EVJ58_g8860 [Rhodofomes roseus]